MSMCFEPFGTFPEPTRTQLKPSESNTTWAETFKATTVGEQSSWIVSSPKALASRYTRLYRMHYFIDSASTLTTHLFEKADKADCKRETMLLHIPWLYDAWKKHVHAFVCFEKPYWKRCSEFSPILDTDELRLSRSISIHFAFRRFVSIQFQVFILYLLASTFRKHSGCFFLTGTSRS